MIKPIPSIAIVLINSCLFISHAWSDPSTVATQIPPPALSTHDYQAPYPDSMANLTSSLLKITALPPSELTKEVVEKTFNVALQPFHNTKTQAIVPNAFAAKAGVDWYFNLFTNTERKSFRFIWGDPPHNSPSDGTCISLQDMNTQVLGQGWQLKAKQFPPSMHMPKEYTKDNKTLSLGVSFNNQTNAECLAAIDIY
jgi:hypothetical protein